MNIKSTKSTFFLDFVWYSHFCPATVYSPFSNLNNNNRIAIIVISSLHHYQFYEDWSCSFQDIWAQRSPWATVGETGGHWDTGSIGTPPLIENPQHTEHMRCNFLDAQEPPLYRSIRTKKIVQYKRVGV